MVIILAVDSKQPICGAEAHTRLKVGSDSQARVTAGLGTETRCCGNKGNIESCSPKTGELGGDIEGGNHPYQSPPPPPAVREPDSSRRGNGDGHGSGGGVFAGGDQAGEVASERIDGKDRRTDDAHARTVILALRDSRRADRPLDSPGQQHGRRKVERG